MNIAWSLAKEYDVHYLGLQSFRNVENVKIDLEDEEREVTQHPNLPRDKETEWDFGRRSLPKLLDELEPDVLLTINDIQMIQHIPQILCPESINLKLVDLPSKKFVSDEALKMQLKGAVRKFKERYPRDVTWIAYCPQDGDPPMPQWGNIYRMADQVVAMSKYGQKIFDNYFDMQVPYIWHGVDSNTFKPAEKPDHLKDKFIVGDINRNQPRKQPIRLIEAFAKFAKDKPDAYLHLQKDWNDRFGWPLKYFTDLYGVTQKCISPREVGMPREEVAETYNAWDINMMCTGGEGFGLPFAESMICGIPNIANDYTTSKELLIDGEPSPRGLLTDYELNWQKMNVAAVRRALVDIDDLVEKLNKYYYDRELRKEHSRHAREWAKDNLAIKEQQDQWVDLIKNSLSEG